jgi:alkyl sulfatase BDS1-like metallo-beta-lactamase superfamily hydrolase
VTCLGGDAKVKDEAENAGDAGEFTWSWRARSPGCVEAVECKKKTN